MDTLNSRYETVRADRLRLHPQNPRRGNLDAIRESVRSNGFYGVIVAQRSTGYILAGNHRYLAAIEEGATKVPVVWVDVDDDRAKRILLADNRSADLATYDDPALLEVLRELDDLGGTLWTDDELAALLDSVEGPKAGKTDPDAVPEPPAKPKTRRGDLWLLGEHRVLCGDVFSNKSRARLLGPSPSSIAAAILDPPYGISLDTDYSKMPKTSRGFARIAGDEQPFDATEVRAALSDVGEQFWFGADYYARSLGDTEHAGAWLVWDKRVEERYDEGFGSHFELIWSARRRKRTVLRHQWFQNPSFGLVRSMAREHPTQKPSALVTDLIVVATRRGEMVLDPFLGSGTALIAAERSERVCLGMEIEPNYVDVAVKRWEQFTGRRAKRAPRRKP